MPACCRRILDIRGIVQGVGFRPALYRLARAAGLGGRVQNRAGVVRLELEGPAAALDAFLAALPSRLPPQARIDSMDAVAEESMPDGFTPRPFEVVESVGGGSRRMLLPVDLAMCADCRREILDPADRRFRYAFTTCTNCGPRYTVIERTPYDRERTTLRAFPLCPACAAEYRDPADRRFHAESTACPVCGPRLRLLDADGAPVQGDPLREARARLAAGAVVAVRGIGGYLLAADAFNRETLLRLRERKHRPHKPLAVMAPDLATAGRFALIPPVAADLLTSARAPICILDVRPDAPAALPRDLLSPDTNTLGLMLPTSPLHELLARPSGDDPTPLFDLLVMTSGNRRGEPICLTNAEAMERLQGIADAFLVHDREINLRNDDSVVTFQSPGVQVWRRARGYAPESIRLPRPLGRPVLAMGSELKNAFALGRGDEVFLSPHVGDLDTPEARAGLEFAVDRLPAFLDIRPEVVAVDLHPDYPSTRLGRAIAARLELPVVEVQHHHAHARAAMAEHGLEEALALAFDGTGLGTDGAIWGAELLRVTSRGWSRLATFAGVPLPGGDAAIMDPRRQLAGRWLAMGAEPSNAWKNRLGIASGEWKAWGGQIRLGVNAPVTHAAGRLFDSVSAALGLCSGRATYDGQAAVRLEACARRCPEARRRPLTFAAFKTMEGDLRARQDGVGIVLRIEGDPDTDPDRNQNEHSAHRAADLTRLDWTPLFAALLRSPPVDDDAPAFAWGFHDAVAAAALEMLARAGVAGPADVVLTGGVFMNRLLTSLLAARLESAGWRVHLHRAVPPNDGGLALGQAVIGGA